MRKNARKPLNRLTLHRETLRSLENGELKEAAGGITPKCPPTYTGIETKPCIC